MFWVVEFQELAFLPIRIHLKVIHPICRGESWIWNGAMFIHLTTIAYSWIISRLRITPLLKDLFPSQNPSWFTIKINILFQKDFGERKFLYFNPLLWQQNFIPLLCLQVFTATSWTYPIYETYFTPLFCLHGFAGEIHRTIPWFFCWLNHLRFGPIQHWASASSPPDRLMSAPWIDGKKHVARKLRMEPENDDFWKNGYIQGTIWDYVCHTNMIY